MNEDVSHIEMDDFPASHVSFWGITVNDLFFKGDQSWYQNAR